MKILILGSSGMIGRTMFHVLAQRRDWQVIGSVRARAFEGIAPGPVVCGIDLINPDHLESLFGQTRPEVVINCAGLTKHLPEGNTPIPALMMNALLPHRLARLCAISKTRLIHVSTDCVFSGAVGDYKEQDATDAADVYGKTKALGEVTEGNAITLRTSTIGHEYRTRLGLLEWFLGQNQCTGFRHAVFSGLPSVEFARVVRDIVVPNPSLSGLYHVGACPIDKLSLLRMIARTYRKDISPAIDETVRINRSLNTEKFATVTGYRAPDWAELIDGMYQNRFLGVESHV